MKSTWWTHSYLHHDIKPTITARTRCATTADKMEATSGRPLRRLNSIFTTRHCTKSKVAKIQTVRRRRFEICISIASSTPSQIWHARKARTMPGARVKISVASLRRIGKEERMSCIWSWRPKPEDCPATLTFQTPSCRVEILMLELAWRGFFSESDISDESIGDGNRMSNRGQQMTFELRLYMFSRT